MTGDLLLHGYFRSSAAWRVRIALNLKGVPYAQAFRHLRRGEQSAPDYLAQNPQGLVPALDVAGRGTLTQSLAIVEWIEESFPGPALLPGAPWARARVRALAGIIACDVHPIQNLRVLVYLKRDLGAGQPAVDAFARHWISLGLDAVEARLAEAETGAFCHGDAPGMADLCLVPQLGNARRFGLDLARWPRVLRVEAACAALPAFAEAAPERQPDAE
ncbi:maleylacetoacetate isomerase [Falsiroseomonas sp. CW058]|uniref:maleylacetoacetate isomerase n=1 Tax=Falsiroseomonas sp. CW058 TaxID=3388664 RepID=UPI003D314349